MKNFSNNICDSPPAILHHMGCFVDDGIIASAVVHVKALFVDVGISAAGCGASPFSPSSSWCICAWRKVRRGEIELNPWDQQALENNITVVKILEAAKKSAASGKAERIR